MSIDQPTTEAAPETVTPEVVDSMLPERLQDSPAPVRQHATYADAIEAGKVLAASGLYPAYRDAAKAAVAVMIGIDLGVPATTAIRNIHPIEQSDGKISFVIESKLMSALILRHPTYSTKVLQRDEEAAEVQFLVDGVPIDDGLEGKIRFSAENAAKAKLMTKRAYQTNLRDMLYWRAISEGVRVYFPDLLAGQSLYLADADLGIDNPGETPDLMAKLEARPEASPLTDERAEKLKAKMRELRDKITAANPDAERVLPGQFARMIKTAEHSHGDLEDRVGMLEDMLAGEVKYVTACGNLKAAHDKLDDARGYKAVIERAERRGDWRGRLAIVEEAMTAAANRLDPPVEGEVVAEGDAPAEAAPTPETPAETPSEDVKGGGDAPAE